MEGYILRCPTGIHTRSFILQYTFMWPILFFGRLRHCMLCGWYYNLYGKWKNKSVISALETSSWLLFWWFNNNFMKSNGDKSHLIMSCKETATTAILMVCPLIPAKQKSSPRNNNRSWIEIWWLRLLLMQKSIRWPC